MIRIANCSGFYGDRLAAARELVEGGPIDVLTGDYLAELTMLILAKSEQGYARTFVRQMEEVLGACVDRGIKVVANAGGLDPAGLAQRVRELGTGARVAYVEGDDLRVRFPDAVTANAYLGCWGIVEALSAGADVVVCPRVADASLVVGPAAWRFDWARDDWDRLAGAVVAGHVLECGAQATGGNYAFFEEVPELTHPGFPIAEMHEDGGAVITKHDGTGGLVSVGTVTAQLLYEIGGPRYLGPDAVARFDTIRLEQEGPDRVRISGVQGEPPPPDLKVCVNELRGFRNRMTFVLTGLAVEAKAALVEETLRERLGDGIELDFRLIRSDKPDAPTNEEACAHLQVTATSVDRDRVGRAFSSAAIELALASYPGFTTTALPGDATAYGVYRPAFVPCGEVEQVVVLDDGTRIGIEPVTGAVLTGDEPGVASRSGGDWGPTRRLPLGALIGARSGDKGGDANVGVWARTPAAYEWLEAFLSVERLKQLVGEAASLEVRRYELPNMLALNFVVEGLLGEGVAASTRPDPQAKGLGEYLRSRVVDLPEALL